jgi:phosphatidyl-myo-inositol dimannoside synthase
LPLVAAVGLLACGSDGGMRVVAVLPEAYGGFGGIAQYLRDFLSALASNQSVEAITVLPRLVREHTGQLPPKVEQRNRAAKGAAAYASEICKCAMERNPYDLVICGHLHLLPFAKLLSIRCSAPLMLVVYGVEAWKPSSHTISNVLASRVEVTISISSITIERLRRWAGSTCGRDFILPNAVHLDQMKPGPKRQDLLERYGIGGRKVLMTLGRLVQDEAYKGVDKIIRILSRLLLKEPNLVYFVAGDGNARPYLERLAQEIGVARNVIFAGRISEGEKKDIYSLADAFVLPGRNEGFGFVLLEAMACGVPVLASTLDGSREAVQNGALGWMINPDDANDLTNSVLAALKSERRVPPGLEYFDYSLFQMRLDQILRAVMSKA